MVQGGWGTYTNAAIDGRNSLLESRGGAPDHDHDDDDDDTHIIGR